MEDKFYNVKLTALEHQKIKIYCVKNNMSMSKLIHALIVNFLAKEVKDENK